METSDVSQPLYTMQITYDHRNHVVTVSSREARCLEMQHAEKEKKKEPKVTCTAPKQQTERVFLIFWGSERPKKPG